jgi:phosphate transport system substrate-binding protein
MRFGKRRKTIDKKMKVSYVFFLLISGFFLFSSCGAPGTDRLDDIQKGEITIVVDESLSEPIETGIFNFENINKGSKIHLIALPEQKAFQFFKTDTARLLIATRELRPDELKYFEQIKITPRYTPIGYDAVVLIGSKNPQARLLSLEKLKKLLKGEVESWNSIFSASDIVARPLLVFAGSGAGTMNAIMSYFDLEKIDAEIYALNSSREVVEYVSGKESAIGIISLSWVNGLGKDDAQFFENAVQVIGLDNPESGINGYFFPDQTSIADDTYPLRRKIIGISREARVGLGTGFVSFMASERGQRIILKSGLLPLYMPSRELIIYDNQYEVKY